MTFPKQLLKAPEWSEDKRWNPFNSYKLLAHVYRWRLIKRGSRIPQPVLVTIDPIQACNLSCSFCNSSRVITEKARKISRDQLLDIANFLPRWKSHDRWERGVESICIAGGGEPLLHPDIGAFIHRCLENKIQVGVVTNGTLIHRWLEPLSRCTWVGVSVDAGCSDTFRRIKGKDKFDAVLANIKELTDYSLKNKSRLSRPGQGHGVSFKFLLHPDNIKEVYTAAGLAKSMGCRNFHLRPAGMPWHKVQSRPSYFQDNRFVKDQVQNQIALARELQSPDFGVFGITHKFDPYLNTCNCFAQCHAIFMTAVFMPSALGQKDRFDLGLCCDRRGDPGLVLKSRIADPREILSVWGSSAHWEIFDRIRVDTCPRCTYQPHNQLFEKVILEDNMTYRFI